MGTNGKRLDSNANYTGYMLGEILAKRAENGMVSALFLSSGNNKNLSSGNSYFKGLFSVWGKHAGKFLMLHVFLSALHFLSL